MADNQVQLTPDQAYLQEILSKFNINSDDPSLDDVTRTLLQQVKIVQQEISEIAQQVETLNAEIKNNQDRGTALIQKLTLKQGESQGYVNTLLKLKK